MNFKGAMFGVMGLVASLSVSAQTIDYGSFVLDFDDSTLFGAPTVELGGPGGLVNLSWSVPGSVNLAVNDGVEFVEFALPSFTITAANAAQLSGAVSGLSAKARRWRASTVSCPSTASAPCRWAAT